MLPSQSPCFCRCGFVRPELESSSSRPRIDCHRDPADGQLQSGSANQFRDHSTGVDHEHRRRPELRCLSEVVPYDSSVISFATPGAESAGLTGGSGSWNVTAHVFNSGPGTTKTLHIEGISNDFTPLSGAGTLFDLEDAYGERSSRCDQPAALETESE